MPSLEDQPTAAAEGSNPQAAARDRELVLSRLAELRPLTIKPAAGLIRYPYCIPGGFYNHQWDWDGFFIACHYAGRTPAQPEYIKYWTLNVLASALPDGDVASCITPAGVRIGNPSLRLKPFLAQGAELAARLGGDAAWLAPHYAEIVRIATRRETSHYLSDYGLFVWTDAMESGATGSGASPIRTSCRSGPAWPRKSAGRR